ncbi:MAG TPA: hypothetical protein V6C63_00135 [Allocoleopsis sp.]
MQPIRQGDVILIPVDSAAEAPTQAGEKLPHLTLAEGEVTGHSHRISVGEAELRDRDGTLYLTITSDSATLTHEEHKPIQVPQGNWIVRIQRQYEPGDWSYVED